LDIGVLGYIGIVQHKEHSPEVLSIPPGTPCITVRFTTTLTTARSDLCSELDESSTQLTTSFLRVHLFFQLCVCPKSLLLIFPYQYFVSIFRFSYTCYMSAHLILIYSIILMINAKG